MGPGPGDKEQLQLLERADWDVLIVLDACRADALREVTGTDAPAVRSPGVCTPQWIAKVGPLLERLNVLYFTANPVVDREVQKRSLQVELISIWKRHWSRFTRLAIPSVHPLSVNGVVLTYLEMGRLEGRRVVIHYLQPHSPYIGAIPLAVSRWGRSNSEFGRACHALTRPDVAVRQGAFDWTLLKRAYRMNLALAWDAARQLAGQLTGTIIVTSDHGEMLGEDGGKFGHEGHWRYPQLYAVPWLRLDGSAEREAQNCESDVLTKLEALGYA